MSYCQFYGDYRYQLLTANTFLPPPYQIQYQNQAPNISNVNYPNFYTGSCFTEPACCFSGADCYDATVLVDPSIGMNFRMIDMVSNVPDFAIYLDINILQPWGILVAGDKIWVTNVGTGIITCYNLLGVPLLPVVNVFGPLGGIARVTGICYNWNLDAFQISRGPIFASSAILVCTRGGTIHGYNSIINANVAQLLMDNSNNDAVYTGIAVVNNLMYVADFYNQKIDVYNENMVLREGFNFVDENADDPIPFDYSPYNIVLIGDFLYVSYAKQRPNDNQYEMVGSGYGYVSIFRFDGTFVKRFTSNGLLNVPWGIIRAPSAFGYPAGSIMISNYGDGVINIFDENGCCIGPIRDRSYNSIDFGGIRGLAFNPSCPQQVFWAADRNVLRQAFVGTIVFKGNNNYC